MRKLKAAIFELVGVFVFAAFLSTFVAMLAAALYVSARIGLRLVGVM